MTIKPQHAFVVTDLCERISVLIPSGFLLRAQNPISLSTSEPEPDLAIIRGTNTDFRQQHPSGSDCELIIEVSDSSLKLDQGAKRTVYATGQIPEYWVVNLIDKQVEVYSEPKDSDYSKKTVYSLKKSVPLKIKDQHLGDIPVADVIPNT